MVWCSVVELSFAVCQRFFFPPPLTLGFLFSFSPSFLRVMVAMVVVLVV
jgi:hypothetical protein